MKTGHSVLNPFRRFVSVQEKRQVTLAQGCIAFASVILARNFVESILEGNQVLGFTPLIRHSFYSFFDHFSLFYVSIFLWVILVLSLLARAEVRSAARLAVLFSPVILLVPVIDIVLSRGAGYKLGYLEGMSQVLPAVQFFDLKGQLLQVTWGQRVEVISVCCLGSAYVWLKRCSWWRSALAFVLIYFAMFVHGLPQALADIPKLFGFDYGVRAIVGGGLVDVDSQNYALFMLLLCIPAALLLVRKHDRSLLRDLNSGMSAGRSWAPALLSFCGLGFGYLCFREHYYMTFINPYNYLAFGAAIGIFVTASAVPKKHCMILFAGAISGFLALNLGWTCLLFAACVFIVARFRRTLPLVLVFSLAGGFSLFGQHHTLSVILPGGRDRLSAFATYRQAREYFIQKDWDQARKAYEEARINGIESHELYERLAESYVNLSLPDRAVPSFEKAIAMSSNDPESYLGLGGIYHARGEYSKAIEVYTQAIDDRVLPDRFHLEKARIYSRIGEFGKARNELRTAALTGVKRDLLYQALGDIAFFSSEPDEALRFYRKVLLYKPGSGLAYNGMANVYHVQGRFQEALELYTRALESLPNDPTILNNAGAASLELGRLEDAYNMVSKALVIYPMLAEAHYNMGRIFELAGAKEQALESYRNALAVNPNVSGAREAIEALEGSSRDERE